MAFLKPAAASRLATLAQYHDAVCRHDLYQGFVTSERDYVSNLATHFRYPIGSLLNSSLPPTPGLIRPRYLPRVTSLTLPPTDEQLLGFDGVIVLSKISASGERLNKIGFFEAKWPRMFGGHVRPPDKNIDRWDKMNASGESHYSRQLITQNNIAKRGFVLWEQFFSEEPIGVDTSGLFHKFGSTCVLHRHALSFMRKDARLNPDDPSVKNGSWKWSHLQSMLTKKRTYPLGRLIYLMARCYIGKPFPSSGSRIVVDLSPVPRQLDTDVLKRPAALANNQLSIPILTSDNNIAEIHEFMRDFGIRSYTHFTINEEEEEEEEEMQNQRNPANS